MSPLERRLKRLEAQRRWAEVQAVAAEWGIAAHELLDEARYFLALSDAEQDAELAASIADAKATGNEVHVRILMAGWAAIRSYR